jgi:hypothetical protein
VADEKNEGYCQANDAGKYHEDEGSYQCMCDHLRELKLNCLIFFGKCCSKNVVFQIPTIQQVAFNGFGQVFL